MPKKQQKSFEEEIKVTGKQLVSKVKELVREGNIRKIIIKNEKGESILEIPMTLAAIGSVIAPLLAAVGAIAALATNCTIVVKRRGK